MCGILLFTCDCDIKTTEIVKRGPDCQNARVYNNISLFGCVLHQQGSSIHRQPLEYDNSALLWNGENYQNINENDGLALLKNLNNTSELDILNNFSTVSGPFAMIYVKDYIYFGRDVLGRRSLVFGLDMSDNIVVISSVIIDDCSHVTKWIELPAIGIFKIFPSKNLQLRDIELYPYDFYSEYFISNELIRLGMSKILLHADRLMTNYHIYDLNLDISSIYDEEFSQIIERFLKILETSIYKRVTHLYKHCADCILNFGFDVEGGGCDHSKVAILFSGGIDSAVLAALADRCVPIDESIDLLNVSFSTGNKSNYESPDRKSGLICLEELKLINPTRRWNFVQIDVSPAELKEERENRIAKLINPCDSVLDDSIGCALWFAARGIGYLLGESRKYISPARVILTGIGADELMAGYSRHRCVFERFGYEHLQSELDMELHRISSRNMGRDDRVLSSHGKEARFPFLDEDVVSFLMSLPIELKCDLTKDRGLGEKMILRLLARDYLQLHSTWANHKRAIQFGSQIAKVDRLAKGDKASQKCKRLDIC